VPWNRTRDPWICSQELWPLDHRGGPSPHDTIQCYKYICNISITVIFYTPNVWTFVRLLSWYSSKVHLTAHTSETCVSVYDTKFYVCSHTNSTTFVTISHSHSHNNLQYVGYSNHTCIYIVTKERRLTTRKLFQYTTQITQLTFLYKELSTKCLTEVMMACKNSCIRSRGHLPVNTSSLRSTDWSCLEIKCTLNYNFFKNTELLSVTQWGDLITTQNS
jgi:hypothetical protein